MKLVNLLDSCSRSLDFKLKLILNEEYEGGFPSYSKHFLRILKINDTEKHIELEVDYSITENDITYFKNELIGLEDYILKIRLDDNIYELILVDIGYSDKLVILSIE